MFLPLLLILGASAWSRNAQARSVSNGDTHLTQSRKSWVDQPETNVLGNLFFGPIFQLAKPALRDINLKEGELEASNLASELEVKPNEADMIAKNISPPTKVSKLSIEV